MCIRGIEITARSEDREGNDETYENNGDGRNELDEDVERRAGSVLEGVADSVADDSGLVALGALAAVVASLDVLLGIVPGAAGVGHEHSHGETGDGYAAEQTYDAVDAEDEAGDYRNYNGKKSGEDHLMKSALGAESNAFCIVGISGTFHYSSDLAELAADFNDDGLCGALNSAHGESGEDEREHSADEQTDEKSRVRYLKIHLDTAGFYDIYVGDKKSKRGKGGRTDCKALAGSGSGVAERVESVGTLTDFFRQTGHLGDAARVVGHGSVRIGCESDAERGEHADCGDADSVETLVEAGLAACCIEADDNGGSDDQDRSQRGAEAERDAADDDGGGTGLGSSCELLGGLIGIGSVVLGEIAYEAAADESAEDGNVYAPAVVLSAENEVAEDGGNDSGQDSGKIGTGAQACEERRLRGFFLGLYEEGANEGADDAAYSDRNRKEHSGKTVTGCRA